MSKRDDVIKKGLFGKAAVNEGLSARQERLSSTLRPERQLRALGHVLGESGDVRFIGDLVTGSLYSSGTAVSHPRRNRRLVQEVLVYGPQVLSEGTNGTVTGATQLDTDGVDLTGLAGLLPDLKLIISNNKDRTAIDPLELGSFRIDSFLAGAINTQDDLPSALVDGYYWQVIAPGAVRLLPYPKGDGQVGGETAYLITKPQDHPIYNDRIQVADSGFSFAGPVVYDGTDTLTLTGQHVYAGQVLSPGDFALVDGRLPCLVRAVVFTPGAPNTEVLTLDPLWGPDLANWEEAGVTVAPMPSLRDVFTDLDQAVPGLDTTIFNVDDALDAVRVKALVDPARGPSEVVATSLRGLQDVDAFQLNRSLGYGLVLYPADGAGAPDLSNPIYDLEAVTIDPSVSEDQYIMVDHAEGILYLSHPIPASGGDLNPAGYTAPDGRRVLYAMVAAYGDAPAPQASSQLVQRGDLVPRHLGGGRAQGTTQGEIRYQETVPTPDGFIEPVEKGGGWVIRNPEASAKSLYHQQTASSDGPLRVATSISAGAFDAFLEDNATVQRYQSRSQHHGLWYQSLLVRGQAGAGDNPNQLLYVPNASEGAYDPKTRTGHWTMDDHPDFRITDGKKRTTTIVDETAWTPVVTGVSDELRFAINDVLVEITLPAGAQTAAALRTALINGITAAAAAVSVPMVQGTDFDVLTEGSSGSERVSIEAKSYLFFLDGNGHGNFLFPTNTQTTSRELHHIYGFNGAEDRKWTYDVDRKWVKANFRDIRLDNSDLGAYSASLVGTAYATDLQYPHFVISGCAANAPAGAVVSFTPGIVKHQNVAEAEGETLGAATGQVDLTGEAAGLYYVYWSPVTQAYAYILRTDLSFDPYFISNNVGVPVALVTFDGANITAVRDRRFFARNAADTQFITVGARGQYETLSAACLHIHEQNLITPGTGEGVYVMHLLEDMTLDGTVDEEVYLPSNLILDLGGHRITVDQYTGGSGTGPFVMSNPITGNATSEIEIRNGIITLDSLGTIGGGTAPDLFRQGVGGAAYLCFSNVVFSGVEDLTTFLNCAGSVKLDRVTWSGPTADQWIVTTVASATDVRIARSTITNSRTTVGFKGLIDVNGSFGKVFIDDSDITVGADMGIIGSTSTDNDGMLISIDSSRIAVLDHNMFQVVSASGFETRFYITDTLISFNEDHRIIVAGVGDLDYMTAKFSHCNFSDNNADSLNLTSMDLNTQSTVEMHTCTGANLFLLATSPTATYRINSCDFAAGATSRTIINLNAGNLFMSDTELIGTVGALNGDCSLQVANSRLVGFSTDKAIRMLGGIHKISSCNITGSGGAAQGSLIEILDAGAGAQTNPLVQILGCNFIHNSTYCIRVDATCEALIVNNNRFERFGVGQYALLVENAGATRQINLQISGGVMQNYGTSVPTFSDAVVIGTNADGAQFSSLLVRNSTGLTDFLIDGSATNVFTETSVRFIS